MDFIADWIAAHPGQAFVLYVFYMTAVQTMPRPDQNSGKAYTWFYGFAHALSANFRLAADPRKRAPEDPEATEK